MVAQIARAFFPPSMLLLKLTAFFPRSMLLGMFLLLSEAVKQDHNLIMVWLRLF